MTTHVVADDVLGRVARKEWELNRRIMEGSVDPAYAAAALQEIIERKFVLTDKFGRYTDKLLSLAEQLDLLKRYNKQYWEGRLDDPLDHYTTWVSDHLQRVDDLEILHVEFGSPAETIEMWWRVWVGEQPKSWRWDELKLDPEHFQLLAENVDRYEAGIHRLRIDLTAHWEPETGRTLEEVRVQAKVNGETLAHTEVMSAYGLHTALLREQDGENLPYSDMAGTDVSVPCSSRPHALYASWFPFSGGVRLDASGVGDRDRSWAAPVLRKS